MKITEEVSKYATEQGLADENALKKLLIKPGD